MKPALHCVTVFVASIAAAVGAFAQEPAAPRGNWASLSSDTYYTPLHPVVTGAEFYLKIEVSNDGSFRGEWGEYYCSGASLGAYGFASFPCRVSGTAAPVSGRFGPGRQGVIDLGQLGRSTFIWSTPAADDVMIELPKDWRGDAVLWRARLTRDGKGMSSDDLARYLDNLAIHGKAGVAFLIGGALGLSDDIIKRADRTLSLSPMTLTHELARLMLTEQLYRAGTIVRGEPYHKARR